MSRWLTSLVLSIAFAGGALAGIPLHSGHNEGAMADCCDKAKSGEQSTEASAARLCCAVNCGDSAPTSSGLAVNPASSIASGPVAGSFAPPMRAHRFIAADSSLYSGQLLKLRPGQPRYIQNNSFLI